MKLYLSSYRIPAPDELISLMGKKTVETKVAVIPNAQDYYIDRVRRIKIQDVTAYFETQGFFDIHIVDLREQRTIIELKRELQQHNLIWVMGGNTFCLSYEMDRSGFSKIIKDVLDSGVVYGGESAGAIMAGNSLKGIEFADPPEFAEQIVWDTLNLVPNFILPHADNQAFAKAIDQAREAHKGDPTIIELADNQALVVNNDGNKIVGAV